MRLYKLSEGILIESNGAFYLKENEDWDDFLNDDGLYQKMKSISETDSAILNGPDLINNYLEAPIQSQEIWASGVTYLKSRVERQEESKEAGGAVFYAMVYEAERPELFFKALAHRTTGHGGTVRIRKDSTWNVPEPELTLCISSSGKIIGYTIGNDMSSRSIEGENPLYLPQAKVYEGSTAIGPCIYVTEEPLPGKTEIHITIERDGKDVFEGTVTIDQIKRKLSDLVTCLYSELNFPHGSFLMTGTGIVPQSDFTLQSKDKVTITIDAIGTLVNIVE